jgi:hypothetical protein
MKHHKPNHLQFCVLHIKPSPWTGLELTTLVVIGTDCTTMWSRPRGPPKVKRYLNDIHIIHCKHRTVHTGASLTCRIGQFILCPILHVSDAPEWTVLFYMSVMLQNELSYSTCQWCSRMNCPILHVSDAPEWTVLFGASLTCRIGQFILEHHWHVE